MSDRESREQEARDIAQEAAEAGVSSLHYLLGFGDAPARCEADARRGTGTGVCDRPLDEHGYCDRPGDHLL